MNNLEENAIKKAKRKEYRIKNLKKLRKQNRDRKKIRRATDPKYKERCNQEHKRWRKKNKEHLKNYLKEYDKNRTPEQKKKKKISLRKKLKNNISFKLATNIRRRILLALKGTYKSSNSLKLTGAPSWEFIWKHLESTFKPGMTKENHGRVWHMDHILPCASFDFTKPEEQFKCFHYSNLQALFVHENLSKGAKIL